MGDVSGIAKTVVDKYSQDGIVSLSFGLLLAALLYYTWQAQKQAFKEREAFISAAEKKSGEYMAHVVSFVESTNASTRVNERAVEAIEDLTKEFGGLKKDVERLTDRVDRLRPGGTG